MNITWDTEIYCLIGHPISKSLSPVIHNSFYNINNLNNIYIAFDIEKEKLKKAIDSFKILNIKGFNVTLPHKISIIEYLDDISKEAKFMDAVNTVSNKNGRLIGYNTDGMGFLKSMNMEGIDLKDRNILVLGAGGVANAISISVATEGAKKIFICNRTVSKAERLADKIGRFFPNVLVEFRSLALEGVPKDEIDMVINCTSIGMYPDTDKSPIDFTGFPKKLVVYDTIYKPQKTKFMKLAEKKGYHIIGGLSMLINQALYSQKIWSEKESFNVFKNFEKIRRILKKYVE